MLQIVAEQKERRLREKLGMALSERSETGSVAGSRHSTPPSPTQPLCLQKLMDTFSATGGEVTSSLRLQRLEEQQRMAKEQERRVRVGMPPTPPAFAARICIPADPRWKHWRAEERLAAKDGSPPSSRDGASRPSSVYDDAVTLGSRKAPTFALSCRMRPLA